MSIFSSIVHAFASVFLGLIALVGLGHPALSPLQNAPSAPVDQSGNMELPPPSTESSQQSQPSASAAQNNSQTSESPSDTATVAADSTASMSGTPVDYKNLPLGDGKYTTSGPRQGYVYVCHVMSGGQGAQVNGPWIHGNTWDESAKLVVAGSVSWPQASIKVSVSGTTRTIVTNDLPVNMTTGIFPISASDPAYQYDGNRSSITAQNNTYTLPADPTIATTPNCIYGMVGVMTNGVTLNDAFDALYRDAPAHEEQDSCQGHPNNQEGYHYHSLSTCFVSPKVSEVIGWAFDGFPITGPLLPNGTKLSSADLDLCHGMTSNVVIDGKTVSTYHYVMTDDFPYSIACFKGRSYEPQPGGGGAESAQQGGPQGMPPPPPQY